MTQIRTDRLLLTTLTRDEAAAIRAGDRTGRAWAEDYPTEGDVLVASVVGEAGEHYDESATFGVLQVRLRSITALTAPGNVASHGVLVKAGFTRGGLLDVPDEGPMVQWARTLEDEFIAR